MAALRDTLVTFAPNKTTIWVQRRSALGLHLSLKGGGQHATFLLVQDPTDRKQGV